MEEKKKLNNYRRVFFFFKGDQNYYEYDNEGIV